MKHGKKSYNLIQDTRKNGAIPKDEPVFLIRGQDALGPKMLRLYADLHEMSGGGTAVTAGIRAQAYKMEEWQATSGVCKIAD